MTAPSSALVVIDMQRIFAEPTSQWFTPRYAAAATQIERLTERLAGNVIWTRFVRDPREDGSWADYYARWDECRDPEDSPVWDLTMPVAEGDRIVSLPTFSKWGEELARLTSETPRLVVCGVATDCCVLSTVLGAIDAGKHVTLVTDACAGASDLAHEQALELMGLLSPMIECVSTDEYLGVRAS
ncbi:MAG: cysteine hydrolase [Leucobacter sp.]|nr:cysteine hydrolase [Leucobacter sp.]